MDTKTIVIAELLAPSEGIVGSARPVADAIIRAVDSGSSVHLDLRGVPGAPSSFFNAIFGFVISERGKSALADFVKLSHASELQREVFERSWRASVGEAA